MPALDTWGLTIGASTLPTTANVATAIAGTKSAFRATIADRLAEVQQEEEIVFIDDNIAHLLGPKNAGFNCFLAAWSNVSESSIKLASRMWSPASAAG